MGTFPYHFKHNFGHGSDGLANLLALLNLLAFAFHCVLDCACDVWHRIRALLQTRYSFYEEIRGATRWRWLPIWTDLYEAMHAGHPPAAREPFPRSST